MSKKNGCGRKRDEVHQHFDYTERTVATNGGKVKKQKLTKCKYGCGLDGLVYCNPERLRRHLSGNAELCKRNNGVAACTKAPEHVMARFCAVVRASDAKKQSQKDADERQKRIQAAVNSDNDCGAIDKSLSKARDVKADKAVANFFFMHPTIPPSVVEKAAFRAMVKAIRAAPQSWKFPAAKRIKGPMLDSKYGKLKAKMKSRMDAPMKQFGGTGMGDGATVHGQPLANAMCVVPGSKAYCLGVENCTKMIANGGHKDGLFYAEMLVELFKSFLPRSAVDLDLLCTDTPRDMQRAWKLARVLLPRLFVHPCTSHCGNCLLKKTAGLDIVANMLAWMLKVGDAFTGKHAPRALLRKHSVCHIGHELGCLRRCEARFGLNFFVCVRLLRLLPTLRGVVTDAQWLAEMKSDEDKEVKRLIELDRKWVKAGRVLGQVMPLALIVKLGDFTQPSMPRLIDQMNKAEGVWAAAARDNTAGWGTDFSSDSDSDGARGLVWRGIADCERWSAATPPLPPFLRIFSCAKN
jgi:hypothetical protein